MHFSATIRAMAALGHEIDVVAREPLQEQRKALGWTIPDFGQARITVAPSQADIDGIVARAGKECVHILVGMRGTFFRSVMTACITRRSRFGIYGEAPHPDGWKVVPKWGLYVAHHLVWGRHADFFLALGRTGVQWYQRCGFSVAKLFPMAYATESPQLDNKTFSASSLGRRRLIFLGRCLPIKRLELALRALHRVKRDDWELVVVGDGPTRKDLEVLTYQLGFQSRVEFLGAKPHDEALQVLCDSDLLVLPSRHEGWGAVVNEALHFGVRVLCSDQCGAADLVRNATWRGRVFRSDSESDLASALMHELDAPPTTEEQRIAIHRWATCINGASMSDYITGVLQHRYAGRARPIAPWGSP